jgi:hypothetical protein
MFGDLHLNDLRHFIKQDLAIKPQCARARTAKLAIFIMAVASCWDLKEAGEGTRSITNLRFGNLIL